MTTESTKLKYENQKLQFFIFQHKYFSLFLPQTRFDFTIFSGALLILAMDLIMFGFICTFYYSYITDVAYGCLGALLYSLVRETHRVALK